MANPSPLLELFRQAQALISPYGSVGGRDVEVVGTFGPLELEYASLRKHCVVIDQPQRSVIEVTGPDRLDFLNRMLTQELKGMPRWTMRRSFWLNRKGRIDADLRVVNMGDRILLECDIHAAGRVIDGLKSYLVMEDASIRDISGETHRLALHGPQARTLLPHFVAVSEGSPSLIDLPNGGVSEFRVLDSVGVVVRDDTSGEPGLELILPKQTAEPFYRSLIEQAGAHDGHSPLPVIGNGTSVVPGKLRPCGWHAYNISRIEAGTPLYMIDFDTDSLPAESGILSERVSFTKGCYLGQEIVARMHARGHPKQVLTAIRFSVEGLDRDPESGLYAQPETGATLTLDPAPDAPSVGVISSATLAPMLASSPIAFARIRWEHAKADAVLYCRHEGRLFTGSIQPSLRFWSRPIA